MLRTVIATEYVTPLREGGSLPAIVEGDDEGTYVVKFRGAGQGPKALIAELVSGEIGRALGLPVPEIVLVNLDPRFARTEQDPEIQDLLRASEGLNLGLDYLPGSITFDPLVDRPVSDQTTLAASPASSPASSLASSIVWFDALITNVDRTVRNPNLLVWHSALWLIDHGASLYFHHAWNVSIDQNSNPFPAIRDHVLLPWADQIGEADARLAPQSTRDLLLGILKSIPDSWLVDVPQFPTAEAARAGYLEYFERRLSQPRPWVEEALRARTLLV